MATQRILTIVRVAIAILLLAVEHLLRGIVFLLSRVIPIGIIGCVLDYMIFDFIRKRVLHRSSAGETPVTGTGDENLYDADTPEMITKRGYACYQYQVETSDGYVLVTHRIPHGKNETRSTGKEGGAPRPAVLLMHGFLMNSEVWVARPGHDSLPFLLADAGFDCWLLNNRGNKYSQKHRTLSPKDEKFWDFSIDDLSRGDLTACINFVCNLTGNATVSYIGFSQGTAQGFQLLSADPVTARKISLFIAMAPATRVQKLPNNVANGLVRATPEILYAMFGRRSFLPYARNWKRTCSRKLFAWVIQRCVDLLFNWKGDCISAEDKASCYAHLYSTSSTKTVVQWFQIMCNERFQMYDDFVTDSTRVGPYSNHAPFVYPLRQIDTPMAIFYGSKDTLPDMEWLLTELPSDKVVEKTEIANYEHLDFLWAKDVRKVYARARELLLAHLATASAECMRKRSDSEGDAGTELDWKIAKEKSSE